MTDDHRRIDFHSAGTRCDAWFFDGGADSPFDGPGGRPVVVMAHGFGGTKDSGLEPYARRFAAAGLAVFAFDYRGFGDSDGTPRQQASMTGQIADYRAAITAAAALPGIDPRRIVVWGVSLSGGHALSVAADRTDVCAVVAAVPLVNGMAAGRVALAQVGARAVVKSTLTGIRSALGARLGRPPILMPLVGKPGEHAAFTAEGYAADYLAVAGPSWRNEVDAAVGLELGGYRADRAAARIAAPVLIQIADFDRAAPPHAAAAAATAARAEVKHYPGDHFDVFEPKPWFEPAVTDQLEFLRRHLLGTTHEGAL
ncbi:alpha/beta hydrolase [Nocardia stercoris]|uniref:Alpha/beta hydrolase n=1 Tax=Nocardia stercoris TaxID=2483361 RepID=A0A3M2LDR8_9NOCA|nr:alpha/beta hydrolase [Nocardia stercoris]RMI34910.1 alpha/beta hydrolase [Nocardia stercoris]